MFTKRVLAITLFLTIVLTLSLAACEEGGIPNGTYENRGDGWLYTIVVQGNRMKISSTENGVEGESFTCTYVVDGDTITLFRENGDSMRQRFSRIDDKTIGVGELVLTKR